ncbi:MAG: hypothetical protein NTAFB01_09740 [Nitrospira sp.]
MDQSQNQSGTSHTNPLRADLMAGLMLTTKVMVTELPEEKKEPAMPGGGHSHGMEGMY